MNEACMECLAPWAVRACGVDWNNGSPIMVEARLRRGSPVFTSLTREAFSFLQDSRGRTAIVGGVPPGRAMAVWLQSPLSAIGKARRILPTLLDMAIPFALDDCVYDFSPFVRENPVATPVVENAESDGHTKLASLAAAARSDDISALLADYTSEGINPHILDHEGLALWAGAQSTVNKREERCVHAVVWVRDGEAILALGNGRQFWSAHRIGDMGGATLMRTVRVQLHTMAGGRFSDAPLIWLWGGTAPSACKTLRMQVEETFPVSTSLDLPGGETFLARALARRALLSGPFQFNLRCDGLAHPEVKPNNDAVYRRRAGWLAAAALVLLAANVTCWQLRKQRVHEADVDFKARIDRVTGWPVAAAGEYALLTARRELAARREAYQPVFRYFAPSLLEPLSQVLADVASAGVSLRSLLLQVDKLALKGLADSREKAEALVSQLEAAGFEVKLNDHQESTDAQFVFEMTGKRGQVQP